MNMKYAILSLLLLIALVSAQSNTGLQPYPGTEQELEAKATPSPIPPIFWWIIGGTLGLGFAAVMFLVFIAIILFVIKILFFNKRVPEYEILKKERIGRCKSWNGSNLGIVRLFGDKKNIQGTVVGYCSGFAAEGEFDYITYHTGLPGYLFLLKMIKGPRFQLNIPIIDISIPRDFIIQLTNEEHSAPGPEIWLYGSGVVFVQSGYEAINTTTIDIATRMKMEQSELVARSHGEMASLLPRLAEEYWDAKPEAQKGKPPSSRVNSGK